jgi:ribosomal protein L12E/L44/L45/RPP1/RPP2
MAIQDDRHCDPRESQLGRVAKDTFLEKEIIHMQFKSIIKLQSEPRKQMMRKRTVAQAFPPEELSQTEESNEEESEEEDDDEGEEESEEEESDDLDGAISESSYESTDSHYGFFYPEGHI